MASSLRASLAQRSPLIRLPLLAVALAFVHAAPADAQRLAGSRHADHWLFGTACRLSWNEGGDGFTFSKNGMLVSSEGTAVWSRRDTGELVLYSDGVTVWNASHTPIVTGLWGSPSAMHSAVIVPVPGQADQLYVFAHGASITNALSYQKFDISSAPVAIGTMGTVSLGAGLGREGMLAIDHANGVDYWLLVSGATSIFILPITTTGVGAVTSFDSGLNVWVDGWHLFSASHQGDMIAMSGNSGGDIAIWDFDRATGMLSRRRIINPTVMRYQYYGGVFSADRSKLYFATLDESNGSTGPSAFYQFDFDTGGITQLSMNATRYMYGDGRLGPDGKIYIAGYASNALHVIDEPDLPGAAAGFHFAQIAAPVGCTMPLGMAQFAIYSDECPNDANKLEAGVCGCGVVDFDTDGDAQPDCKDACPTDANKVVLGECGCHVPDTDTDEDSVADCNDGCPTDPNKTAAGACGCGIADSDTDGDGTPDCTDGCPADPMKASAGACGCGAPDRDRDRDGVVDCSDPCVDDADGGVAEGCGEPPVVADAGASDAGPPEPRDAADAPDAVGPTERDPVEVADAGLPVDAGRTLEEDAGGRRDADVGPVPIHGGCSCRAAGELGHSRAAWAWAAFVLVWIWRRKRRAR